MVCPFFVFYSCTCGGVRSWYSWCKQKFHSSTPKQRIRYWKRLGNKNKNEYRDEYKNGMQGMDKQQQALTTNAFTRLE